MASDLSNSVQVLFDRELKAINDLSERLDQYEPGDMDLDVISCKIFLFGVKLLLIRNLREAGVVRYLVEESPNWTGSVLLLITKDTDHKDFESTLKEIQALGVAIDYQIVMEVDYIGRRTVSDPKNPDFDLRASNVLPIPVSASSATVHQKSGLQVLLDKKMTAISDFAHKLKQLGPRHKEVVGLTRSFLGVELVLIRNLCEAVAVKHLMQKGWTGSVVLVLSRGTDLHDFDLSVKEIVESCVPGFKILTEVEIGPENPIGVVSDKSSAMVYQQQPWYDDPVDDDAYHSRRVRQKIDERIKAIQTRVPPSTARVGQMQSQLDLVPGPHPSHPSDQLLQRLVRENQRLVQENQRLQRENQRQLVRENQRLHLENQRLAALLQADA